MSAKIVRNIREPLKKPRPLKSISIEQPKDSSTTKATDILSELEALNVRVRNLEIEENLAEDISQMCSILKNNGEELDSSQKDVMERYFCTLRNVCRDDRLDVLSRLKLLEIIELRAQRWKIEDPFVNYFSQRFAQLEASGDTLNSSRPISPNTILNIQNQNLSNMGGGLVLSPGEVLKSSGKFNKPTKIAGKNYFKDEIVIRNCDSGKVNVGARDRLVQITGPHEEAISHAKYLVEDTIKRNVSPVRDSLSESRLDNRDAGESVFDRNNQAVNRRNLMHSLSMSDASLREISLPVQIGNSIITISGTNTDLLKTAKKVLMDYFSDSNDNTEKDSLVPLSKSPSSGSSLQRFPLKKQTSLKENLGSVFVPELQPFSQRSSSSASWSSDDIPVVKDMLLDIPIPPPSNPSRQLYSREFLLQCAQLPLSKKLPSGYQFFLSDIKRKSPVMFDPSPYLQEMSSQ